MFKIVDLAKTLMSLVLVTAFFSPFLQAEENENGGGEEGEAEVQAIYLPIKPAFVVNYGGAGRLRYIKTDVSVRVADIAAANAVRFHMPYVRNSLLMLLASQTSEIVSSQEGKEKIRRDALKEIRDIIETEESLPRSDVVEVFFNNFIVQN